MNNVQLFSAKRLGRSFKFTFIDEGTIETLRYQYVGSESSKFDDAIRKMKKLVLGDQSDSNNS